MQNMYSFLPFEFYVRLVTLNPEPLRILTDLSTELRGRAKVRKPSA